MLRLLLAFSVVLAHSNSLFGFVGMGGNAVTAFFIVSGFYMSLILTTKYQGMSRLWLFYSNRVLRLFPVYWAVLVVFALASLIRSSTWPLKGIGLSAAGPMGLATDGTWPSLLALVPNLFFVGSDVLRVFMVDLQTMSLTPWLTGMAEDAAHQAAYKYLVIPPIWSLGVEVVFYAMAPFMALLRLRWLVLATLALWGMKLLLDATLAEWLLWYYLLTPVNLCFFATGMVAHRLWPIVGATVPRPLLLALAALPFGVWGAWQWLPVANWQWLVFAGGLPALFDLTRSSKRDNAISAYSYPIYLTHTLFTWPMMALGGLGGVAAFALSALVSAGIIAVVDVPVERWRQSRAAGVPPSESLLVCLRSPRTRWTFALIAPALLTLAISVPVFQSLDRRVAMLTRQRDALIIGQAHALSPVGQLSLFVTMKKIKRHEQAKMTILVIGTLLSNLLTLLIAWLQHARRTHACFTPRAVAMAGLANRNALAASIGSAAGGKTGAS